MKKITKTLICGLILCFLIGNSAFAANTLKIGMDQFDAKDGTITVYVNQNMGNDFSPMIEKSKLLIGKQEVPIQSIDSFKTKAEAVSYLCIVDVSGSMDAERIEQAKESIKQLADAKSTDDNFCITKMGNELTSSGFLTNTNDINTFVDGIEVTREDTNLYHSIGEVLNQLKTDTAVHQKRCVIIYSDGADDQDVGITKEEAENAVKESHIPIFTIALLKENASESQIENAKLLGSFARYSAGGAYYAPALDKMEIADVANEINQIIDSSLIITADVSQIIIGDEEVYIETELSDGTETATNGMTVPAGKIIQSIQEAKEKAEETEKEEPEKEDKTTVVTETTETVKNEGIPANLILPLAILLVVIFIILIISIVIRKKNTVEKVTEDENENIEEVAVSSNELNIVIEEKPISVGKKVILSFYKLGPGEEEKLECTLKNKITIGRTKKCTITIEDDTALSSVHCSFSIKNGKIFITDEKSTNGTYVNGVPIVGEFELRQDDVLLIGSYEYRVCWR